MSEPAQLHDPPASAGESGHAVGQDIGEAQSQAAGRADGPRHPSRAHVAWRCARYLLGGVFGIIVLAVAGMAGLAWRLSERPLSLDAFAPRITEALQQRLADGFLVSLTGAALERRGSGPTLTVL